MTTTAAVAGGVDVAAATNNNITANTSTPGSNINNDTTTTTTTIREIVPRLVVISGYWMIPDNPKRRVQAYRDRVGGTMEQFHKWCTTGRRTRLYYFHNFPQLVQSNKAGTITTNHSDHQHLEEGNSHISGMIDAFVQNYTRPGWIPRASFRYTPFPPPPATSKKAFTTNASATTTTETLFRAEQRHDESEKEEDKKSYSSLLLSQEAHFMIEQCLQQRNPNTTNINDDMSEQERQWEDNRNKCIRHWPKVQKSPTGFEKVMTVWLSKLKMMQSIILEHQQDVSSTSTSSFGHDKENEDDYYYAWIDGGLRASIWLNLEDQMIDPTHVWMRKTRLTLDGTLPLEFNAMLIFGTARPLLRLIDLYLQSLPFLLSLQAPLCRDEEGLLTQLYHLHDEVRTNLTRQWGQWGMS
jgi:hypothetical protein